LDREFLGRGWGFPLALDNKAGGFVMRTAQDDIKESIYIILSTTKGERLMRPDFGCSIHNLVFSIINTTTITLIEQSVNEALTLWEPRILVENIKVKYESSPGNKCLIDINYLIRSTNDRRNLVYPFYLND